MATTHEKPSKRRPLIAMTPAILTAAAAIFSAAPVFAQTKEPLQRLGQIELPAHQKPGGFDHADVHPATGRVFVAHTANDALHIIDVANDRLLRSIPNLKGVAGALVSPEANLVFTSNRGEDTVGIFPFNDEAALAKVPVGASPN